MTTRRVQLTYFAIPLGLAGQSGAWTAAQEVLHAPEWPSEVFAFASLGFWLVLGSFYLLERARQPSEFRADREHPASGPNAALLPIVGILLVAHWAHLLGGAAPWIMGLLVLGLLVLEAQLVAFWLRSSLPGEALHPGYFLPVVAGPFIACIGLDSVGLPVIAAGAFGVGLFFWLVLGTIITGRLMTRVALAPQLAPTIAVLLAPPAVGGVAWMVGHDGALRGTDRYVAELLAGVVVVMLVVQLALIPLYRTLHFSLAFWAFTFPVGATANFVIRFTAPWDAGGVASVGWGVLGIGTLIVLVVSAFSILFLVRARRSRATS